MKEKKRDKRIYEEGAVFESIFTESKNLTKDEFNQLITSLIRKEANLKNPRGSNGYRGIVPCLQGRNYTP